MNKLRLLSRLRITAGFAVGLLASFGVAQAQDNQPEDATQSSRGQDTQSQTSKVEQVEDVPPDEMKKRAEFVIKRIDAVEEQIAAMVIKAKDDRDVVRVLCLSDKSNQVALALGTAKDRQASMLSALVRDAIDKARHEYRLLIVIGDRVDLLAGEANQCLGGELEGLGDSTLIVNIDPNLPATDPGVIPLPPLVIIIPLPASVFD